MKYAVVKIGAKQYKVKKDDEILVEKIEGEEGKTQTFDQVLLLVDGKKRKIGQPTVPKASVKAKILSQTKGKKIRVATYKAKSRYRKVKGHRQFLTKIAIEIISN